MADVRCPMCGKSNPSEAEVCLFCQARLKPLVGGEAPHEPDSPAQLAAESTGPDRTPEGWGSETGLPDWLTSLRQDESGSENAAQEAWLPDEPDLSFVPDEPESLDWLHDLRNEHFEDAGESLEETGERFEEPEPPEERAGEAWIPQEKVPGWLDELPPASEMNDSTPPPAVPAADEPDWLRQLHARQQPIEAAAGTEPDEPGEGSELPEPESYPGPSASDPGEPAESIPPFTGDEELADAGTGGLPEWLMSVQDQFESEPPEEPDQPAPETGELEASLAAAVLPAWLEAMRPVESAAPLPPDIDEDDQVIESSGPLSGLRGVLPAEPEVARARKPVAYSVKLQVTENQQSHAAVLEELVKNEGVIRPLPARPVLSSLTILRWVIFLVLFLGIGWPVWTASQDSPLPALTPEVETASELIDQISSGAPVLVAVDYQPGLSPELDATSGVVIDHLMIKGAYLALVSTSPTGPVQAERLVNQVNRRGGHQYVDLNQFANLGFIPGGTAGLLGLAEAPRRILPFGMAGSFAWQAAALQPIERLDQFALVAVLTEDPETARAWIEQVGPYLGQTPLLMVVSAQAEPVVRPYYESRPQQIQGLVSGLAGGATYEKIQARPGLARKYWDAFSLGLVLAAALIVIGGIASAVSSWLANRKPVKGEKAA